MESSYFPGNMPRELAHNFMRDASWTTVSALNINAAGRVVASMDPTAPLNQELTGNAFVQPMTAQWLFGSAPMLLVATGETIARKMNGEEINLEQAAQIWTPAIAASLAIPMWDTAQTIGNHIGTTAPCFQNSALWYGSSLAGGLLAAPFVGMFEGFTQWSVKYLADVATNPVTQEMWRKDPELMGKLLAKDFFLNITIGAIPGAVWQIVYFLALPALIAALGPFNGILLAAILVALAVMYCNFTFTHAINRVSAAIDKEMGWDPEALKKLAEDTIKQLQATSNQELQKV